MKKVCLLLLVAVAVISQQPAPKKCPYGAVTCIYRASAEIMEVSYCYKSLLFSEFAHSQTCITTVDISKTGFAVMSANCRERDDQCIFLGLECDLGFKKVAYSGTGLTYCTSDPRKGVAMSVQVLIPGNYEAINACFGGYPNAT